MRAQVCVTWWPMRTRDGDVPSPDMAQQHFIDTQAHSPCAGPTGLACLREPGARQGPGSRSRPSIRLLSVAVDSDRRILPLFSVVMTVASSGSPQPCLVLADNLKMYADSGASSVAVNCLTVAPTSTVVNVLGLLLARR